MIKRMSKNHFLLPEPQNPIEVKQINTIDKMSISLVGVFPTEESPELGYFTYSLGAYFLYDQPEMICFGMGNQTAASFINTIVNLIKEGKIELNKKIHDLSNLPLMVSEIADDKLRHVKKTYTTSASWLNQHADKPYRLLQVIWSDRNGILPHESGYDATDLPSQPIYYDAKACD